MAKKILIVEDEKPMARALELKLDKSGFEADLAYDGKQALTMLGDKKYDLILLDLVMPVKDGFDVLKDMKKKGDKTPVIVSTNLSQGADKKKTEQYDIVSDYFVKSDISISEVVERVKKVLK